MYNDFPYIPINKLEERKPFRNSEQSARRDNMESLDYWRLCEELSIQQAALLIVDCDPSQVGDYVEQWDSNNRPKGYEAAKTALVNALRRGTIDGTIVPEQGANDYGNPFDIPNTISIWSLVQVDSLRAWLKSRGFHTGFFFADAADSPDYLDPTNTRYAPKLAASVRAWQAVTDPGKKSAKQALEKWLREHAAEFGLVDDEGNPINQAIEECSKVANWNQGGGAPKSGG